MQTQIIQELHDIEVRQQVEILYACESGSRAWGFPSPDSDYDVRFIYAHDQDWYLSITAKRDVIELQGQDVLDINGWDLRKALAYLRKSNATMLEWLSSPIVYLARNDALTALRELAMLAFRPGAACHHYLGLARKSLGNAQEELQTSIKTYLYALRPILCCQWILSKYTQPPMLFATLLDACLPAGAIRSIVDDLLRRKQQTQEKTFAARSVELEDYLQRQLEEIPTKISKDLPHADAEPFNLVFRQFISRRRFSAGMSQ